MSEEESMIYRILSRNNPHIRYKHPDVVGYCSICRRWRTLFVPMGKKHQKAERRREAVELLAEVK